MRRKSPFPYVKPVRRRGRVYFYFERLGFERVRLPGAWGSAEFQEAYKAALAGETAPPVEIGAERTKPGSVSAAIALYLDSGKFRDLAPDTKRGRRVILDRFRERFGELPIKGMKPERIEAILAEKTSKHSALSFSRHFAPSPLRPKKRTLLNLTRSLELTSQRSRRQTDLRHGPKTRLRNSRRSIRLARAHDWPSHCCSSPASGGPMLFAWAASMSRGGSLPCASKRPARLWKYRCIPSFRKS